MPGTGLFAESTARMTAVREPFKTRSVRSGTGDKPVGVLEKLRESKPKPALYAKIQCITASAGVVIVAIPRIGATLGDDGICVQENDQSAVNRLTAGSDDRDDRGCAGISTIRTSVRGGAGPTIGSLKRKIPCAEPGAIVASSETSSNLGSATEITKVPSGLLTALLNADPARSDGTVCGASDRRPQGVDDQAIDTQVNAGCQVKCTLLGIGLRRGRGCRFGEIISMRQPARQSRRLTQIPRWPRP